MMRKIYSGIEQRIKNHGGYIKTNDGIIKFVIKCNGTNYRDRSLKVYNKLLDFFKSEGFLLGDINDNN